MSITMFSPAGEEAGSSSSLEWQQLCSHFTFAEVQLATQNFSESLVIGHGGFGNVYKGSIIRGASRVAVAVKRLDSTSNQGAIEFWAEVEMLSKLRHCHLVSLIGYCNEGQEMILVYEYMPHGTLADHLHKLHTLTWERRLKICIGAARGLDYLHTGTGIKHGIIHRDVKSSNILLEKRWAAKISDFGLSKVGPTNQQSTYVNTFVKGTFGYLDPDYFATGRLTRKSDVYAFGVVLFEVLCSRRAVDTSLDEEQWGLARWAQDSIKEGRLKQIIDPNLRGKILPKCLKEFTRLANRCLDGHPKQRPTMAEVVFSLESVLSLQEKANHSMAPAGITIFGRKVPMFLLPSNGENSGGGRSLQSLDLNFYTDGGDSIEIFQFEFDIIRVAIENSSESHISVLSGINSMYKGRLHNGQGIAVKRFDYDSQRCREYCRNEVSLLVKLGHENLVQLLGYCVEGTKLFLIYDFALYASLDSFIFGPVTHTILNWNKRYKILLGVARGLLYLHKHAPIRIVHCDLKPRDVLLDENLNPKISNFQYARSSARGEADHIDVSIISGSKGYMAPEYATGDHLSTKVDVFDFGMLVLETIGGHSNNTRDCRLNRPFLEHTWTNWWEGTSSNIIDPTMDMDSSSLTRYIQIGLLCVQSDAAERPTMDEVVEMLISGSSLTLPIPKKTAYSYETAYPYAEMYDDCDYDSGAVEEFMSELCPR